MQKNFYEFKDDKQKAVSYIKVIGNNPKKVMNLLRMYDGARYSFRELTEEEFNRKSLEKIARDFDVGVSD
ncbi:MAG: hypothetical protein AABY10_04695 [Nanoarchaeota archaeon]